MNTKLKGIEILFNDKTQLWEVCDLFLDKNGNRIAIGISTGMKCRKHPDGKWRKCR